MVGSKKKENNRENNRFLRFFQKKKGFLNILINFFAVVGFALLLLITIEQALSFGTQRYEGDLAEEAAAIEGVRHHPFLDFTAPSRETKNYCSDTDEVLTIFTHGGSTMWGVSSMYDETIPSYLSEILCEKGFDVDVFNYGVRGYNNLQETVNFFLQLKSGKEPDIVIFYDGVNDVRTMMPEIPFLMITKDVFEYYVYYQRPFPLIRGVLSNFYTDMGGIKTSFFDYSHLYPDSEENNYTKLAERYISNIEIIKALEDHYSFKSFFYWQPNLGTKKILSKEEKELLENDYFSQLAKEYREVYYFFSKAVEEELESGHYMHDISDVFDNYGGRVYTDDCHKLPIGNKIVAERMAEDIIDYLNKK